MITVVYKYRTDDGDLFDSREEAEEHEAASELVSSLPHWNLTFSEDRVKMAAWILKNFKPKGLEDDCY